MIRRIKKFGQCFLTSSQVLDNEVSVINPLNKTVLEIGAGDGRLTERIANKALKVYAVETDKRYTDFLIQKFSGYSNVEIIDSSFLDIDPFKVDLIVGNIPYYISSLITFKLLDWDFKSAFIMYQKEFAIKLTADGNDRSRISFFADYYFIIRKIFDVPRALFSPRPKVDSTLVQIIPKKVPRLDERVQFVISFMFQHKRKTVGSLLNHMQNQGIINGYQYTMLSSRLPLEKHLLELDNKEILKIGKEVSNS